MIYGKTPEEIEKHRKAFIRKWRLNTKPGWQTLATKPIDRQFDLAA
jgi:hypothetical protein